jgi:hypothetical protein
MRSFSSTRSSATTLDARAWDSLDAAVSGAGAPVLLGVGGRLRLCRRRKAAITAATAFNPAGGCLLRPCRGLTPPGPDLTRRL